MGKENQDAWFIERPSRDLSIFAVFDGHGKRFGKLAGEVASRTLSRYLRHLHRWATHEPEAALSWCFRRAHEDIRQAMLTADPGAKIKLQRGVEAFLLEYMPSPDGDGFQWDAVDGGTTATVALFIRASLLTLAVVGDSSAVLLGRQPPPTLDTVVRSREDGKPLPLPGEPTHRVLMDDHTPTNLAEYVRLRAVHPRCKKVNFVYDCPDFEEFAIYEHDVLTGEARLSEANLKQADEHGVMVKNSRNDRFTLVLIPESKVTMTDSSEEAQVEEQAITMTRSLGDFYAHEYGVTEQPEMRTIPLAALGLTQPHLLLASDGIWDIWGLDEVASKLIPAHDTPSPAAARTKQMEIQMAAFCEDTRATGAKYFGEAADNLTGVLIDLRC